MSLRGQGRSVKCENTHVKMDTAHFNWPETKETKKVIFEFLYHQLM